MGRWCSPWPARASVAQCAPLSVGHLAGEDHDSVNQRPYCAGSASQPGSRNLQKADVGVAQVETTSTKAPQENLQQSSRELALVRQRPPVGVDTVWSAAMRSTTIWSDGRGCGRDVGLPLLAIPIHLAGLAARVWVPTCRRLFTHVFTSLLKSGGLWHTSECRCSSADSTSRHGSCHR